MQSSSIIHEPVHRHHYRFAHSLRRHLPLTLPPDPLPRAPLSCQGHRSRSTLAAASAAHHPAGRGDFRSALVSLACRCSRRREVCSSQTADGADDGAAKVDGAARSWYSGVNLSFAFRVRASLWILMTCTLGLKKAMVEKNCMSSAPLDGLIYLLH